MYYCNLPSYIQSITDIRHGIVKGRDRMPMPETVEELAMVVNGVRTKKNNDNKEQE